MLYKNMIYKNALFSIAALVVMAVIVSPATAKSRVYQIDPVHTRIVFMVDHAGLSQALGSFSGITGTLRFDPDKPTDASVNATVPLQRLDFGDAAWRKAVLASNFLAVEKFPEAVFTSTAMEATDADDYLIHGELNLRGVVREVTLVAHMNALKRHPLTLRKTIGFSASTTINRADFGIDAWPNLVGAQVRLVIELEALRGNKKATPTTDDKKDESNVTAQ